LTVGRFVKLRDVDWVEERIKVWVGFHYSERIHFMLRDDFTAGMEKTQPDPLPLLLFFT